MAPFLKWAGGKRWLFTSKFVASLPAHNRFIEPFLGGGAAFFATKPERAILSDVNPELISLYQVVRDDPNGVRDGLAQFQQVHSRETYYKTRESVPESALERAIRTLYLNRTCWNGLYRLNSMGNFNVPIGTKQQIVMANDDFAGCSQLLKRAQIICSDFEKSIDMAGDGDLLFVDPPYTVKHNMNGFVKYNESIFSWNDQVRLHKALVKAADRGARLIITNADHESVRDLYYGVGQHLSVPRRSVISGINRGRSSVTELLVTV